MASGGANAVRVAVHGAEGRMGQEIMRVIADDAALKLVAAWTESRSPRLGQDVASVLGGPASNVAFSALSADALPNCDVVIDFSTPGASALLLQMAQEARIAVVCGTTGLTAEVHAAAAKLANVAPVLVAANMSLGVAVLRNIAAAAVRALGADFDIELVEMHHRAKVDAPSGTALALFDSVAAARGVDRAAARYGREGQVGARTAGEIGIMTLRGGDVVGDHTVILAGPGERIELTHRAHTRVIFARGAVRAARWLAGKAPGSYSIENVLGLA